MAIPSFNNNPLGVNKNIKPAHPHSNNVPIKNDESFSDLDEPVSTDDESFPDLDDESFEKDFNKNDVSEILEDNDDKILEEDEDDVFSWEIEEDEDDAEENYDDFSELLNDDLAENDNSINETPNDNSEGEGLQNLSMEELQLLLNDDEGDFETVEETDEDEFDFENDDSDSEDYVDYSDIADQMLDSGDSLSENTNNDELVFTDDDNDNNDDILDFFDDDDSEDKEFQNEEPPIFKDSEPSVFDNDDDPWEEDYEHIQKEQENAQEPGEEDLDSIFSPLTKSKQKGKEKPSKLKGNKGGKKKLNLKNNPIVKIYMKLAEFLYVVISKLLTVLIKIPVIGKIFKPLKKILTIGGKKYFPLIFLVFLVFVPFFLSVPKGVTMILPDGGGLKTSDFSYSKEEASGVITNTGDIIITGEPVYNIYGFSPSLNPKTWFTYSYLGSCKGEEIDVDISDSKEVKMQCVPEKNGLFKKTALGFEANL